MSLDELGDKVDYYNGDLESCRKQFVYDTIFDSLEIGNYLYHKNLNVLVFTICAINSMDDYHKFCLDLRRVLHQCKIEDDLFLLKVNENKKRLQEE